MSKETVVYIWPVVLGLICIAEAGMIGDQCDWTGSGLTSSTERAVTPVYLRCREGTVSWMYPRGALRLLLRPPLPAAERDFNVCLRVIRKKDPPEFFRDLQFNHTDAAATRIVINTGLIKNYSKTLTGVILRRVEKKDNNLSERLSVLMKSLLGSYKKMTFAETAERFPARIFVEGARKLVPLYAPDDGDLRELRCFRSRRGRAALYVEADPEQGPKRRVATFKYEARPLITRHYDPATADCRPCSDSELELAFCTSDLVSRVKIVGTEEREDLDSTQLTLRLTKVLRATGSDVNADEPTRDDNYYSYNMDNDIKQSEPSVLHAHVHVWSGCGATAGKGEFVAMARRRLGRLALVCAPRLEQWQRLVEQRDTQDAHCRLRH